MTLAQEQTGIAPAGTWSVDPAHSGVEFAVKHMMIATVRGRFSDFEGSLEVAPDGTVSGGGTVRAASIDTNEAKRDEHLRSADFFAVDEHPEITFVIDGVQPAGRDGYTIDGRLTIRGVTREARLDATVQGHGVDPWGNERLALELRGEVSRKEFGLTWNQALETGGVLVGDRVKIAVDVSAVRAD